MQRGMLIVLAGPSGVGKGTLGKLLMEEEKSVTFSVSATTRAPRPGEVNHVHYEFLSMEEFEKLVEQDAFLEHAQVFGNRYGTLRSSVEKALAEGRNILLDIDIQGALNVMRLMPDAVTVFIQPPSFEVLESRLRGRATETEEAITRRLQGAAAEMEQIGHFRYTIVNDDLEKAYRELHDIFSAERHNTCRFRPDLK